MSDFLSHVSHSLSKRIYRNSFSLVEVEKQKSKFLSLGLNRELALENINNLCLRKFGRKYDEHDGMWSEHLILISALALERKDIRSILEIGTFKGETTTLLGELFPLAQIDTIDLEAHEIIEQGIYGYAADAIQKGRHLYMGDKVNFRVMDSLNLIHESKKFDLIWVDGNHVSPTSIIDISNSIRLLSSNGVAVCDDVYLKPNSFDYVSDASSFETLRAFENAGVIKFTLIKKRVSKRFNNLLVKPKYLGVYSLV